MYCFGLYIFCPVSFSSFKKWNLFFHSLQLLIVHMGKKRNYRAENLLAPVECDSPCHHKADMYWTEKWEMERARKMQKWWSRKKKREENLRLQQMCPLSSPISSVISSSALKMNCAWFLQCPYKSSRMTAVSINAKLPLIFTD